jgi:chromate reductase
MTEKLKILAISGSTRQHSSNLNLLNAIGKLGAGIFDLFIFEGLTALPHFNPDLDQEDAPTEVADFRKQLRAADGILVCTPEYAAGVPGTLKNALDWTVSSMEFSKRPVALITASLAGIHAHKSLLGTLLIIESRITADTQLVISGIKAKVNDDGVITDPATLDQVNNLIGSFVAMIRGEGAPSYLTPPSIY